jgi:tetrapyrrole methylase family protein/MazG family protein
LFISKIAEKENRFTIKDIIKNLSDKLVRRHPHIFADVKVSSIEEVKTNWDNIKKLEKKDSNNNLPFGVSKNMPLLIYAQKIIDKMKKNNLKIPFVKEKFESKNDFEKDLLKLIIKAQNSDIDIENVFRKFFNGFIKEITGDDLKA